MILSIVSLLVILGIGYVWVTRGFFSALVHLVCTIIAGAVAFAAWEPLGYIFLDRSPTAGMGSFISGVAWALALALPFAATLAVLRVIVDKLLPANVIVEPVVDYIGGGVCGAAAGVITAGILTISVSHLRLDQDSSMAPARFEYSSNGSLVRDSSVFLPVDAITAKLYGSLSERAFSTAEPLARWHPNLHENGSTLRINFAEGKARNTARTTDFQVVGRFTVGEPNKGNLRDLLKDRWQSATQQVSDPDGQEFPPGSYIEGFVVNFKPGAKEKDGKVVVGAAQLRLLCESADGEDRRSFFPIAVASQADPASPGIARWRFDASDTYIASVGGSAESYFAFEFVVPPGYTPIALYVKGARHLVQEGATATPRARFNSAAERDAAIMTGYGFGAAAALGGVTPGVDGAPAATSSDLDTEGSIKITTGTPASGGQVEGVRISHLLPIVIQKGTHGLLELDEENDKNVILNGEVTLTPEQVDQTQGLDKKLKIQQMLTTNDTVLVQVDVSANSKSSILGKSVAMAEQVLPPTLVDTNGERYQPIGYYYRDESRVVVSFKPGEPIQALSTLPTLSRSRPAQRLTLIFRVSFGRSIKYFSLGTKVVNEYDPPFICNQPQTNR